MNYCFKIFRVVNEFLQAYNENVFVVNHKVIFDYLFKSSYMPV